MKRSYLFVLGAAILLLSRPYPVPAQRAPIAPLLTQSYQQMQPSIMLANQQLTMSGSSGMTMMGGGMMGMMGMSGGMMGMGGGMMGMMGMGGSMMGMMGMGGGISGMGGMSMGGMMGMGGMGMGGFGGKGMMGGFHGAKGV